MQGAKLPVILLLLLAAGARLAWALVAGTELWFDHVFNDVTAWSMAQGNGFTASLAPPFDPAVFRTPGYSAFVAAIYAVAGHSVRAVFVAQALLDTVSCLLLWRVADRRFGPRVGRFVLFLAATYPFTIHMTGRLSAETLLVFLCVLLVALLDAWPRRGDLRSVIAVGVLAGALAWVKPVFLPLPAFILVAEWNRGRTLRTAILRSAIVGGLMAVLFLPWVARNVSAFGRPILAGEIGLVVWHGTHDFGADRDRMVTESFESMPDDETDRYEATRARFADSHRLLEADRRFLERGIEAIRERPVKAALLDPLRRIPRLWISTTWTLGPRWIGWGAATACVGYLILAALGALSLRGRLRELSAFWVLPALLTSVYALIHVEARYTIPARPTLLVFAGVALAFAADRILRRRAEREG